MPTAEELAQQQEADAKAEAERSTQTLIHSAVVTHLKKMLPAAIASAVKDSFAPALEAALAPLKEQLATHTPAGGEQKDLPKGGDIENHPLVKGLQKTIGEQKLATERIQAERDTEKAKARDASLRQRLNDALTAGGIDPRYVRQASGVLVDVDKRVRFVDDDGDDLVFKDSNGDVDLATGLKGWLKSDDAKIFLPPRGTQGAGDRSAGRSPQPGQQPASAGKTLLGMAMGQVGRPGSEG